MYQLYHKTSIHHTVLYPALYHNLWFIYHLYIDVGVAIVTLAALISTQCPIKPLEEELFSRRSPCSISHTWFFSSTLLTFYWDINSVQVHICSQKYHMHWGQMLTFNRCMESLWDIAQVKLVHCSGWQPEVSLRRCSPVRGIWSGRRRSGRASSTFLSQTHRSGPWGSVGSQKEVDESAPEVVGEVEEGKENAVLLPCCLTRNPRVVVGGWHQTLWG